MIESNPHVRRQRGDVGRRANRLEKFRQRRIESRIRHEGDARAIVTELPVVLHHARRYRISLHCGGSLRGLLRLVHHHAEKFAERPRPLRGLSSLDLVKHVARRRIAGLDDVVIVPVAVHAHMLRGIGQKINAARAVRSYWYSYFRPVCAPARSRGSIWPRRGGPLIMCTGAPSRAASVGAGTRSSR